MTTTPTNGPSAGRRGGDGRDGDRADDAREAFAAAAEGFVDVVRHVGPERWTLPALGSWDVRGLVGHASRSLSLLRRYLDAVPDDAAIQVGDPVAYYKGALSAAEGDATVRRQRDAEIAERGREAGAALGADPARAVEEHARTALAVVDTTPDDAPIATAAGVMTLAGYLPTRTFELAVHSLDLAAALGLAPPPALRPAVAASCLLAGHLAAAREDAGDLLLLMTGRVPARPGLSVL